MSRAPIESYTDPNLVPSRLGQPAMKDVSVVALASGWAEDVERLARSIEKHCHLHWELTVVSNDSSEVDERAEALATEGLPVKGLSFSQHIGYGGGCNAGIRVSEGAVVAIMDPSVEATGDFMTPVQEALQDQAIGLVGKWGLITSDLRHFHEEESGEVDAMEGYLMAFRRADAERVEMLDPKFRFYRNADIDFSLRFRDRGMKVVTLPLPLERHKHREWEALAPDQRDKKSRENHARLMRRWRDRTDLLTGRAEAHHHD